MIARDHGKYTGLTSIPYTILNRRHMTYSSACFLVSPSVIFRW